MTTTEAVKGAARTDVERVREQLVGLSHRIWDDPELAFEEEKAADGCAQLLAEAGFSVEAGVADLPTAFVAEYGSGPLTIGICAEYDALPGVGHACGHNMIAASALGAGIGLARIADDIGVTIRVLGTPAEEGGGGKILMLEKGAFDGIHLAMMIHPAPLESDVFPTLASTSCEYHFHGKAAHSSMAPQEGINAADAVTVAQVAIGLLRQHLPPGDQVHGIVLEGGDAPNIVPRHSSARYITRAPSLEELQVLQPKVDRCFEAGALATGARLERMVPTPPYSEFLHDEELAVSYRANASALGRRFAPRQTRGAASTDMANISLMMPTIHPSIGLDCAPAVNHQPEFAAHCRTTEADQALVKGAIAMAWTCIDAADEGAMRQRFLAADTVYGGQAAYPWTTSS
ncbi:MAG: M20 family metallopeptidase [Actinomycetota bacterium]